MGIVREILLRGSQSRWLSDQLTRRRVTQRAVKRFMPGETLDDALEAVSSLAEKGISTILTLLGENVSDAEAADAVVRHYLEVLDRIQQSGFDAHISLKPTQFGLDIGFEPTLENLERVVKRADELGSFVAIDMEATEYVDRTIELYRHLRAEHSNVALCLQAYLYRTTDDLEALLPLAPAIRLVKGAYKESPDIAYARKKDVDANYMKLAERLIQELRGDRGVKVFFGTHDGRLIRRILDQAEDAGVPTDALEIQMLYGIQRAAQLKFVEDGYRMRVLVSYGDSWFPWYMRRLAERPANVLFMARNLFAR